MGPILRPEVANQIWTILVEEAGAPETERKNFVWRATAEGCTEWRFQGNLGFGGKFYNDGRWRIGCYSEHDSTERLATIDRTNRRLESLRAGLIDNRLPV